LPLALTDNLNFGNPERPEIMGQFVGCVRGIAEACRVLDFPVVSGNVSLYNETNGRAILPTPTIGGVGLIEDFPRQATLAFKAAGEAILLIGATQGFVGQSLWLRDVCGREEGAPPPVDLAAEKRNGDFVRALIAQGMATAVHDISDGGLAVAVAEMAMASGIGADLQQALQAAPADAVPPPAFWFGEDQARYVVTVRDRDVAAVLERAGSGEVPVARIGTTGGHDLLLPGERPVPVKTLRERFEDWFPAYMAGEP
jgi:phosphoribosylformylglycinamidine synthase